MQESINISEGQLVEGGVEKMQSSLGAPVQYHLKLGENLVEMNPLIGRDISLTWLGRIACRNCGKSTKKSFGQGHCYKCFITLASCDQCIMSPERCHFNAGTCREPDWGEANCMQPHYVYLSNASGLKVGITRGNQIPTRWIDQGAVQAIPMYRVASRRLSGLVEVIFKKEVSDRTNWRAMLKGSAALLDMKAERDRLTSLLSAEVSALAKEEGEDNIVLLDDEPVSIDFPVDLWPVKVSSHNLEKNPEVVGRLQGIKGQYLILDTGVINLRKYTGYEVALKTI